MTYRGNHNSNSFNRNFCSFVQFTICNNFSNLNLNQNVFKLQGFQITSRLFVSANQKALFKNLPEHYLIRRTR